VVGATVGWVVAVGGSVTTVGAGRAVEVDDDFPTTMPRWLFEPEEQPASRARERPRAAMRRDPPMSIPAT
jgi:hypothetical protein